MFIIILSIFSILLIGFYYLSHKQKYLKTDDVKHLYLTNHDVKQLQLKLPVLGNQGSGKTVFLATLFHQLVDQRPLAITQVLSADYLSSTAEGHLEFDHEANKVSEISTRDIVSTVIQQFKTNQVSGNKDPQDMFLSMTFGVESDLKPECITHLVDLPGSFFENETGHSSNIEPRIKQADGLIYLIDIATLLPILKPHLSYDYHISEKHADFTEKHLNVSLEEYSQTYRKTLKYLTRYKSRQKFPVWIILSKLDEIPELNPKSNSPDLDQRVQELLTLIQRYFCDALLVPGIDIPHHISLVSADESSPYWQHITQGAILFFQDIKDQVQSRLTQANDYIQKLQQYQKNKSFLAILIILFIIPLIQGFFYINLPNISVTKTWDVNSVKHHTKAYAAFTQPSMINFFKRIYWTSLQKDINALNQIHDDLLLQYQQEFLRELPQYSLLTWQEKYKKQQSSVNRLESIQLVFKEFNESFQNLNLNHHQSHQNLQSSHHIVEQFKIWMNKVKFTNHYQDLLLAASSFHRIVEWKELCKSSQRKQKEKTKVHTSPITAPHTLVPSCVLYRYGQQEQKRLFKDAIAAAKQHQNVQQVSIQHITEKIKPLFTIYQKIKHHKIGRDLQDQVRRTIQESWLSIWKIFSQSYPKTEQQTDTLAQLEQLQNFDQQKKELAQALQLTLKQLEVPHKIEQEWQEMLADACMRTRARQNQSQRQQQLLQWAKPYLDPHRRAQLNFEEFQQQWKTSIRTSLQSKKTSQLDQLLKSITETLFQFDTYQDKQAIQIWRQRIKQFKVLSSPRKYDVTLVELTCKKDLLKSKWKDQQFGVSLDRFKPYLSIQLNRQKVDLFQGDMKTLTWKAWEPIDLIFMDDDVREDDKLFTVQIQTALGLFTPIRWTNRDLCQFKIEIHPQPAIITWLKEEKLMP